MVTRYLSSQISKSAKSILLLGPRHVGKSTLLESLKPDLIVNIADENEYLKFTTNPGELGDRIQELKLNSIVIDEVQRLPSLLNTVQVLIDS